ncbi:unnamed protein product [Euphydryas editha]|uniref:Luciferase n=1 Tax=Euphydryas editha TaxID=104508 RepID=A0AAU9UMD4_EUPED|nr:unnamed protein product [Euphydryas editha]
MLKNKFYLYGNDAEATLPAHLHLGKYMLNKFKSFGDHEAIINAATDERMTFKELTQLTVDIALSLVHIGVKNGDVVSICSENAFIEKIIIFGEPIEEAIGFKEFLTQHANVDDFDTAPVNPLEDAALILFSSGTTGMPKGIRMTHYNYLVVLHTWYSEIYTDWYISFGQTITFFLHQMGLALVYYNNSDEKKYLEIVQDYKIDFIASTPTGINLILKQENMYDISSLKSIVVTGAPCDGLMLQAIKEKLPNPMLVYQYYGMSETGTISSPRRAPGNPPMKSVGIVRDLFVVKILDLNSRNPVGANQRGEICFKSPSLTKGYIGGPVDCFDEDGFFKTGDIGYYDEDKYLYVVDRIKDVIKYDSFTLPPAEMEAVLLQHPAVLEVGVVGAPHETFGELATAFCIRMPLAGGVRFIDKIPRCIGVKVDRKKLKQML